MPGVVSKMLMIDLVLTLLTLDCCNQSRMQIADPSKLDAIFVPIGGGGLIAGIAAFVKALHPHIQVCCSAGGWVVCVSIRSNSAPPHNECGVCVDVARFTLLIEDLTSCTHPSPRV